MKPPEFQPIPEPLHSSEHIFMDILNAYDGKTYWQDRENHVSDQQMLQLDPVIRTGVIEDLRLLVIGELKRLSPQVASDETAYGEAMSEYFQTVKEAVEEFENGGKKVRVPQRPSRGSFSKESDEVNSLKALTVLWMYDMTHKDEKFIADHIGWQSANPMQLLEKWSERGREYVSAMIIVGKTPEARALREVVLSLLPEDSELSLSMRRQIKTEEITEKGLTPDVLGEDLLENMPIHRDVMRIYHQSGIKTVGSAVNTSFSLDRGNERLRYLVENDMNYLRGLLGQKPQYQY